MYTFHEARVVTVTWAWIHLLPWLPALVHTGWPRAPPDWAYTFSVPMLGPYMWYQKVTQLPVVAALSRLSSRAFCPRVRGAEASVYM